MSDTYSEQAVGGGVTRFDSTSGIGNVKFSSQATPTNINKGELVYDSTTGKLRLNVGSLGTPIWRTVTNS